jgi:ATP phosphoribosyltransferase regulatory subunit
MKQGLEKKKLKEKFSKKILSFFKKKNFNFTDLDLLIDTNLLTERSGEQFKRYALTYKDLLGKEISLRPDLTVSTALKYIQEKKKREERYCYYGSAFRLNKNGDLIVFDQLGCEIINSTNSNSVLNLLETVLDPIKKIKNLKVTIGDLNLFKILIETLDLPERWKLRLIRHFPRKVYFDDLLKRLETNYDLDKETIEVDTKRLEYLNKMNQNDLIGGRTIEDIVKRFKKKIKDPRDNFRGKSNVKIIRDYLTINVPIEQVEQSIFSFFNKYSLNNQNIKNGLKKIILINKKITKKYSISFKTDFGRSAEYYTGLVFLASINKNEQIVELARGGEYNNLLKTLGYSKNVPALGGAINLNQLINL